MAYERHFDALFRPIAEQVGPIDAETLSAIIGFDAGGPVSLSTVGHGRSPFPTFVTCELSVRSDQCTGESPPFELMMTCDSEDFARRTLTAIADLSLSDDLGAGHTVELDADLRQGSISGVLLEEFATVEIDGEEFAILRVLGVNDPTMSLARRQGVQAAIGELKRRGSYPRTTVGGG